MGDDEGLFYCERFACALAITGCLSRQQRQREAEKYPSCTPDCPQGSAILATAKHFRQNGNSPDQYLIDNPAKKRRKITVRKQPEKKKPDSLLSLLDW